MSTAETSHKQHTTECENSFLPDLCGGPMVFSVVIIGELLAFVLTLVQPVGVDYWQKLALLSLFIQWVGLSSSAILCLTRGLLCRLSNEHAALLSFFILLALITLLSQITWWLGAYMPAGLVSQGYWEFMSRTIAIGAIVSALALRYFYMQYQWRQRIKAESTLQLQALQARIRPHFLFNSMNTIATLTHVDPDMAERMTEDLADLFRAALNEHKTLVPLKEELALARRYLQIEQTRLGDRLTVDWDIGQLPEGVQVPALTLQPLLENAVYHGIEPNVAGGKIRIAIEQRGERLEFTIENPRCEKNSHRKGNQVALENTRARLTASFGEQASLTTELNEHQHQLHISLPLAVKPTEDNVR